MGIQHKGIYGVVRPFACIQLKQNTLRVELNLCVVHMKIYIMVNRKLLMSFLYYIPGFYFCWDTACFLN